MKTIGLIRHFRVDLPIPPLVTANETVKWLEDYEEAPIRIPPVMPAAQDWDLCLSSDLPRALRTASLVYPGPVETTRLLREIPMAPYKFDGKPRPIWYWLLRARLAWLVGDSSQPERKDCVLERAERYLDLVESTGAERVLTVTHAGFILSLQQVLRRRNYEGRYIFHPVNGHLYVFSRPESE